jgi:hypothetical protein
MDNNPQDSKWVMYLGDEYIVKLIQILDIFYCPDFLAENNVSEAECFHHQDKV